MPWRIPWTDELDELCPWGQKELDTTEQLTLSLLLSNRCLRMSEYVSVYLLILPLLEKKKDGMEGEDHETALSPT